jgi:hypothetical protein
LNIEWAWEYDINKIGGETSSADLGYEEKDGAEGVEVSCEGKC